MENLKNFPKCCAVLRIPSPSHPQFLARLPRDVGVANQWYHENGMIVNESKHQCLILGDTEYGISFPVKDTLEIFGMENRCCGLILSLV